jgi:predicted short-subunit dehydrogenase-like oxidoreductase (DUF2520 family)
MRELERTADHPHPPLSRDVAAIAVVGAGRMGRALAAALAEAGYETGEPLRRGEMPHRADAMLLCVPDSEISTAAAAVAGSAPYVGHTSGATPLSALEPSGAQAFALHPLQTVTGEATSFDGCGCAVAGSSHEALELAGRLARDLGMLAFEVRDSQRAAYHAAASIASNFLVTLEDVAERLAAGVGIDREPLAALVRASVDSWAAVGGPAALTGPIARGDEQTVERQRAAVAERSPEDLELFDALADATRRLATARMAHA